jgi:hypothetical protein
MSQPDVLGDECVAVADGRTDKAEQQKPVLEQRWNIMPPSVCRCPGRLSHPHRWRGDFLIEISQARVPEVGAGTLAVREHLHTVGVAAGQAWPAQRRV